MLPSLPDEEFHSLVDPSNAVAQILLMHFAAVLTLIYPIKSLEWSDRDMGTPNRKTVYRMDVLNARIPEAMRSYTVWPLQLGT